MAVAGGPSNTAVSPPVFGQLSVPLFQFRVWVSQTSLPAVQVKLTGVWVLKSKVSCRLPFCMLTTPLSKSDDTNGPS